MKKLIIVTIFLTMSLFANDVTIKLNPITNIGFIKNPSKKLKNKFPICDAFLQVDWINKEKKIGYSIYDLYKNGKKDGRMFALVVMIEGNYVIGLDAYGYKQKGKLDELFKAIQKGKVIDSGIFRIKYNNKFYDLYNTAPISATLADNHMNVCIEHPDNGRAWIVEGKHIDKIYNTVDSNKSFKLLENILNSDNTNKYFIRDREYIERTFIVVDINYDNKDDYFSVFEFLTPVFSVDSRYYKPKIIRKNQNVQKEETIAELLFLQDKKICNLPVGSHYHYLTTDGQNYFLGNICNLTELTREEK